MKKVILMMMIAAGILAVTSCQKDKVSDGLHGAKARVTFSVDMPGLATRSISDGMSVNIVYWAAFDQAGQALEGMNGTAVVTNKTATFDVELVKYYTYQFVFWAQYEDAAGKQEAYDLTEFQSTGKIKVSYAGNANDEYRDAFYKKEDIKITAANEVKEIKLYRPFAQINFLAEDYKAVEAVGLHTNMKSKVTISNLPDVLNGLDGTVTESVTGGASTTFTETAVPSDPAYFEVAGTEYAWYSMNYILASVGKDVFTSDVTATFYHDVKTDGLQIAVPNVPYQRNYRTNIIGRFFSDYVKVNLIVCEQFETEPGHIVDWPVKVKDAEELQEALAAGTKVTLADDMEVDETMPLSVPKGKVSVLDLNGKTLTLKATAAATDVNEFNNYGNLTVSGGTIVSENNELGRRCIYNRKGGELLLDGVAFKQNYGPKGAAVSNEGKATLRDVTVDAAAIAVWNSGADAVMTIDGGKFNNKGVATVGGQTEYSYGVLVLDGAQLTINDGEFTSERGIVYVSGGGNVTINGGVYDLDTDGITGYCVCLKGDSDKCAIKGGKFAALSPEAMCCGIGDGTGVYGTLTVEGGYFSDIMNIKGKATWVDSGDAKYKHTPAK